MSDTSFVKNIAAGVDRIGLQNTPLIWALAKMPYPSAEERDALFDEIGGNQNG